MRVCYALLLSAIKSASYLLLITLIRIIDTPHTRGDMYEERWLGVHSVCVQ